MERFKRNLRLQIIANCMLLMTLIACATTYFVLFDRNPINEFSKGFQFGVMVGVFGFTIFSIVSCVLQVKNPDYARKKYIQKKDDREALIVYKSMKLAGMILVYTAFIGMFIALYFSMEVFYTLLVVVLVYSVVIKVVKFIYAKII